MLHYKILYFWTNAKDMENQSFHFFHQTPVQIRFNDIDIIGHVNNAVYQNFFDYGRLNYFTDVFGYRMNWREKVLVLLKIEIEYLKPIDLHDNIRVLTKVYQMGNKSLRMQQHLVGEENDDLRCINQGVLVGYSYPEDETIPLESHWRERIIKFEKDISF